MRTTWSCWMVLAMLLGSHGLAIAEEEVPRYVSGTYVEGATRKLGRGLANVVTAPLELIRQPYYISQEEGGLAGATYGLLGGAWWGLYRGLTGIYDVVTFCIPVPPDFRSLIKPEFIYAHGDLVP